MKLLYIDKPECRSITDIIPAIKSVYQLEQEFSPYLIVDFLPNKNNIDDGIIIYAGNEIIKKNIHFDKVNDLDEVRKLLWHYLLKYHNIRDITDKKGCIKDFSQYTTFNVIQGWQNKLKNLSKETTYKIIRDTVSYSYYDYLIKHPVYRLDSSGKNMNRDNCKCVRSKECADNYPPNSDLYKICMKEVEWLCNNGYPNKVVEMKDREIKQLRQEIYNSLIKNNMRVDKRLFDKIITAGLFDHVGNRLGNKSMNFLDVKDNVDTILRQNDYYLQMVEGYGSNNVLYLWAIVLLILLAIYIFIQ